MAVSIRLRSATVVCFNFSEHCCAIGYALTEFVGAHGQLFLDCFSALLLAALFLLVGFKTVEHYRRLQQGYRQKVEAL